MTTDFHCSLNMDVKVGEGHVTTRQVFSMPEIKGIMANLLESGKINLVRLGMQIRHMIDRMERKTFEVLTGEWVIPT